MKYDSRLVSPWDNFCLYWKQHDLLPKLIVLNVFSFIVFAIIENTLFKLLFDMTFQESMKARMIAAIFNTIIGIAWPKIEEFFESKFAKHPIKFLRDKWEEFSLLSVKVTVNICTYALSGHYGFNLRLGIKVGVIVFISFYFADFLKYQMTPFTRKVIDQMIVLTSKPKSIHLQDRQEEYSSDVVLNENLEEELVLEENS